MSTRSAALRAVLSLMACAAVALAVTLVSAPPAAAASKSPCEGRLCKSDQPETKKCWSYDTRRATARCFIRRAAWHYGQPVRKAYQVAYRESRYNWRATNSSSGAAGLYQFMPSTWESTPYRRHSPYHPRWAALAAMWMWKRGGQSHWVTY